MEGYPNFIWNSQPQCCCCCDKQDAARKTGETSVGMHGNGECNCDVRAMQVLYHKVGQILWYNIWIL